MTGDFCAAMTKREFGEVDLDMDLPSLLTESGPESLVTPVRALEEVGQLTLGASLFLFRHRQFMSVSCSKIGGVTFYLT